MVRVVSLTSGFDHDFHYLISEIACALSLRTRFAQVSTSWSCAGRTQARRALNNSTKRVNTEIMNNCNQVSTVVCTLFSVHSTFIHEI